MKKYSLMLALIALCYTTSSLTLKIIVNEPSQEHLIEINLDGEKEQPDDAQLKHRWTILRTLAAGLSTGAFTGLTAYATEDYCWPAVWYLSSMLRHSIVTSIAESARSRDENANAALLYTSSWISSWVAYILASKK